MPLQTLLIRSADRIQGTSSNFVVNLNNNKSILKATRISLASVQIPNTIYNIRLGVNDTFAWNRSGALTCTVAPGLYSLANLLIALAAAMNLADSNNYAFSYTTNNGTVVLTGTSTFLLSFPGSVVPVAPSIYRYLGWNSVPTSVATSTSWTSPGVATLSEPYYLMIRISNLGGNNISSYPGDNLHFSFVVPVNTNSNQVIEYEEKTGFSQQFHNSIGGFSNLEISLWLPGGEACNLNGSEWSMVWTIEHQE